MKLNLGQLMKLLWWGFFNNKKAKMFLNAIKSGMADRFAYKRANSLHKDIETKKPLN